MSITSRQVLLSPAGNYRLSHHSKDYFMINSIVNATSNWNFTAHVKKSSAKNKFENLEIRRIKAKTTGLYNHRCFIKQSLDIKDYDILHHLVFPYRSYNPLIGLGIGRQMKVVIGPVQPPHIVDSQQISNSIANYLKWSPAPKWIDLFESQISIIKRKLHDPLRERAMNQTLSNADVVIAVNTATAKLLAERIDKSKIQIAHYGVDASRFTQGIPAESSKIVAIGNLLPRKGFELLLQAWKITSSNCPNSKLHILGDGPMRARLSKIVAEGGMSDSVIIHGYVPHTKLKMLLTNCRAFVHPTFSEGFPHVRLEAMASGAPVIGTDILGAREMVRDGREGVIVDTGAADQLAAAMTHLLEHPNKATKMGERARKRAVTEYDWNQFGAAIFEIYDRILS